MEVEHLDLMSSSYLLLCIKYMEKDKGKEKDKGAHLERMCYSGGKRGPGIDDGPGAQSLLLLPHGVKRRGWTLPWWWAVG